MSVIAVRKHEGKITIACDSQSSWGNSYKTNTSDNSDKELKNYGKISKVNGMTIGCAGQCSHIALFEIFTKTHKPKSANRDEVLEWIIEFKEWVHKKAQINWQDVSLACILIIENKIFTIYSWLEVVEVKDFDAIGSGMWLAIGAMDMGANPIKAVEVASKYVLTCGGETHHLIIDNQNNANNG